MRILIHVNHHESHQSQRTIEMATSEQPEKMFVIVVTINVLDVIFHVQSVKVPNVQMNVAEIGTTTSPPFELKINTSKKPFIMLTSRKNKIKKMK